MIRTAFQKYPLIANMATSGLIAGSGDVATQLIFNENSKIDYKRTLRNVTYGTLFWAPIGYTWYPMLSKLRVASSEKVNQVARVAVDQLFFAPFVGIPVFYTAMVVLKRERDPIVKVKERLEKHWWSTLCTNWMVWPAFQVVNFSYTPVAYRLTVVNIFSVFWNGYLSWELNHRH